MINAKNSSNITDPPDIDVSVIVRGSVTGTLVLVVLISLTVVAILCKIVVDNRRIRKKIKSQKERKRLTSVTNFSTDGSVNELENDTNSLVDNDAYVSSTQLATAHIQISGSMRELNCERIPVCGRSYSMVNNHAYGSVERDNVFTSSESTYEYI